MVEISHKAWDENEPNTHADRSIPINRVRAPKSLEIGVFNILPFDESTGNHASMIFDASTHSPIGEDDYKLLCAVFRRLNCRTSSLGRYNDLLEIL